MKKPPPERLQTTDPPISCQGMQSYPWRGFGAGPTETEAGSSDAADTLVVFSDLNQTGLMFVKGALCGVGLWGLLCFEGTLGFALLVQKLVSGQTQSKPPRPLAEIVSTSIRATQKHKIIAVRFRAPDFVSGF